VAKARSVGAPLCHDWADGVYLQARMEPQAECTAWVVIGATPEARRS